MALAEFVEDDWWPRHAAPNLKASTKDRYLENWGTHVLPGLGAYELRQITPMLVEEFRDQLERRGVGAATRRKALMLLQGMWASPGRRAGRAPDQLRRCKSQNGRCWARTSDLRLVETETPGYITLCEGTESNDLQRDPRGTSASRCLPNTSLYRRAGRTEDAACTAAGIVTFPRPSVFG